MRTDKPNRLVDEISPYLLQHATNPVDWYPWGDEAFAKARIENKPVFLSIGYSACHWCHVMEHESFSNDSTAAIMNKHFVCIKVDREERPDLDDLYMSFVQMVSGSGGWPMSVFLTPDGKPFFGGTYFPPREAHGRPGFPNLLLSVAEAWSTEREKIIESAGSVTDRLRFVLESASESKQLTEGTIDVAVAQLLERFDPIYGGFGNAPKFPPSYALSLLMRHYHRIRDQRVLKAVTTTLDRMAAGGIYDQLGGGFHRYSVDERWLVPHFEKMLYDNALLAVAYFDAYQVTRNESYQRVGSEILDYLLRDMLDSAGGFHSAQDADSEGKEGEFYVWAPEEIIEALGSERGKLFCDYFDVTNAGNFESGKSILHLRRDTAVFAKQYNVSTNELESQLSESKHLLLDVRSKRIKPHKDDKVLTDWNGLAISAFARGYQVTQNERYLNAAKICASFLLDAMRVDGRLMRVHRAGTVKQTGFITDYAFLINGLIDVYESDFDVFWLQEADALTTEMIEKYSDPEHGGFFMASSEFPDQLVRQKDSYDDSVPSGNSTAAFALLRLSRFLDKRNYFEMAERTMSALSANVEKLPTAFLNLLNGLDYKLFPSPEVAIVGDPKDQQTRLLKETLHENFVPNRVFAFLSTDGDSGRVRGVIPFLSGKRTLNDRPTAYVCRDFVCKRPVQSPEDLVQQLGAK